MRSGRIGRKELRVGVAYTGKFDWTPGFGVHPAGPSDAAYESCCGKELAGLAVEHVEEAVLVCLKQRFAHPAADHQISLQERLGRVVIEAVARSCLKIPGEFACAGF